MRDLKAFLLGVGVAAILVYAAAAAFAVATQAAGGDLRVGVGPFVLVSVETDASTSSTTFGAGLLVAGLAGGALNVVAARLVRRSAEGRSRDVD